MNEIISTCAHESCGKTFPARKGKLYCSSSCRAKACLEKKHNGLGTVKPSTPKPALQPVSIAGLPPHAQFIIEQLKREVSRFEDAYKDEKVARKKLAEEKEKLRQELADYKNEQRIKEIESAKPEGLSGFLSNPAVQELMPHIGPALGRLVEKVLAGGAAMPMAGVEAGGNEMGLQVYNWMNTQPAEIQQGIHTVINDFAGKSTDQVKIQLQYIINLLSYGTTATPNNGTFG